MTTSQDEQKLEEAILAFSEEGSTEHLNTILDLLGDVYPQPPQNLRQLFKIIYDKDLDREQKRRAAYINLLPLRK